MNEEETTQAFLHSLLEHKVLIEWKPQYNLGIPVVDEQHRAIVATINSLHFAIQNEQGENILQPVINMVKEYTRIHFEIEENFFRICDFPDLESHQEMHKELGRLVSQIGEKSIEDKNPLDFLNFLKEWFIDHVCQKDRRFKEFLLDMNR